MSLELTVRQLKHEDASLDDYRALRIRLWPDCLESCDREIEDILANPDVWAVFIVSLESEGAAGFIEVHLREFAEGADSSPVAFIEGWYVLPEQRKHGLGRALLRAAEIWALSQGCRELGSDTQVNNYLSIEVHRQLGFQEVERLVCFLKRLQN